MKSITFLQYCKICSLSVMQLFVSVEEIHRPCSPICWARYTSPDSHNVATFNKHDKVSILAYLQLFFPFFFKLSSKIFIYILILFTLREGYDENKDQIVVRGEFIGNCTSTLNSIKDVGYPRLKSIAIFRFDET